MARKKKKNSIAQKDTKIRHSSRRKKPPSLIKFLFKWMVVLGLWCGIITGLIIAWYAAELPDITKKATFEYSASITIKAANGETLARYGDIRGQNISVSDVPSHLIYAVLSIEDRRFYQHFGIDPLGLARAIIVNIQAGRTVQGGSTITQQLAKNLFLSQERTLKRKIQEALLALWLENELTKDEILSAYLNRVYLGSGTYGVDAAARLYFHKPVQEINLKESAVLAGLLKAPTRYSPHNNPDLADKRAQTVISSMVDAGFIIKSQADELKAIPLENTKAAEFVEASSKRYFTDWVMEQLKDMIGTPDENIVVETTLDPHMQTSAQSALSNALNNEGTARHIGQGAVLVLRHDGAVLAMIGGKNYAHSQFNRTTQAIRQPGSSFKPFLYLTALEKGWEPDSTILDAPFEDGDYRPQNFNDEYLGEVELQTALKRSLNTAATRLMKEIGPMPVINTARNLGITSRMNADLSLALGTSGVSLLELTNAYATIANNGLRPEAYGITKITNDEDELYYIRPRRAAMPRVINRGVASTMRDMMESVIEDGTGRGANLPYAAGGKTGTSQDYRDAWFVGFTDEYAAGVWLGNDDNSPMDHVTGGSLPASIWKQIMLENKDRAHLYLEESSGSYGFSDLLSRLTSGTGGDVEVQSPGANLNN